MNYKSFIQIGYNQNHLGIFQQP